LNLKPYFSTTFQIVILFYSAFLCAQEFPSRAIKIIVPYGPGGVDLQVRAMVPTLAKTLGQSIVIENKEGGGATIGTNTVKNALPDGYTLLFTGTSALAVVPQLRKNVGYSIEDFSPIGNATSTPLVIATRIDAPYTNLQELILYAKNNPDKVNMASAGIGTSTHMAGESFQIASNVNFTHVPYRGVGAATQAILGGNSDIVFGLPGVIAPHISSGKMRVLASMGNKRSEFFPNYPTLIESGFKVTEITRFGFFAPKSIPPLTLNKLIDAVYKATLDSEFNYAMKSSNTSVLYLTPTELRMAIDEESSYWGKILKNPKLSTLVEQ
jgi:tripartite-type tricarboxylate transporter receptor subunit TctC